MPKRRKIIVITKILLSISMSYTYFTKYIFGKCLHSLFQENLFIFLFKRFGSKIGFKRELYRRVFFSFKLTYEFMIEKGEDR